mmetsp:Transcript_120380/g.341068  ORF Transcript_120380/g.341068 Transcript_120380/m.341068 type:complete len:314 (+) Transcript_120380:68-1009(+)
MRRRGKTSGGSSHAGGGLREHGEDGHDTDVDDLECKLRSYFHLADVVTRGAVLYVLHQELHLAPVLFAGVDGVDEGGHPPAAARDLRGVHQHFAHHSRQDQHRHERGDDASAVPPGAIKQHAHDAEEEHQHGRGRRGQEAPRVRAGDAPQHRLQDVPLLGPLLDAEVIGAQEVVAVGVRRRDEGVHVVEESEVHPREDARHEDELRGVEPAEVCRVGEDTRPAPDSAEEQPAGHRGDPADDDQQQVPPGLRPPRGAEAARVGVVQEHHLLLHEALAAAQRAHQDEARSTVEREEKVAEAEDLHPHCEELKDSM